MVFSDRTSPREGTVLSGGGRRCAQIFMSVFRGGWRHQPSLKMSPIFKGGSCLHPPPGNPILGAVAASPAPENEPYFQGRVVPSPAPKDAFSGAGKMLQYPALFLGAGYICIRPWKKNEASLEIVSVVVYFSESHRRHSAKALECQVQKL